jgi:hypothetical protein
MATTLPKVQSYVSEAIYEALLAYKTANNLNSTSLALAKVLAEFFGLSPGSDAETLQIRIEVLERRVENLVERVEELSEVFSPLQPTELTNMEMVQRLGICAPTIAYQRKKVDFPEWSHKYDPEGIAWTWDPKARVYRQIENFVLNPVKEAGK